MSTNDNSVATASIVPVFQTWKARITYVSTDDSAHYLEASFIADTMDLVYRYLQRKFSRLHKAINHISVEDGGFQERGDRLTLRQHLEEIIAFNAAGEEVSREPATAMMGAYPVVSHFAGGRGMRAHYESHYTPPPPRPTFPALSTYAGFEKLEFPAKVVGSKDTKFRAKFYDVFPKEE